MMTELKPNRNKTKKNQQQPTNTTVTTTKWQTTEMSIHQNGIKNAINAELGASWCYCGLLQHAYKVIEIY